MARTYAGILGPLAMMTSLVRGLIAGGGSESVLWTAWGYLLVFAAIGGMLGWIAERTVEDAVHGRIAAELAAEKTNQASAAPRADAVGG